MLQRSRAAGVKFMIITGGSLKESRQALKLAKEYGEQLLVFSFLPFVDKLATCQACTLRLAATPPVQQSLISITVDPRLIYKTSTN